MNKTRARKTWVIVEVQSGVAVGARVYADKTAAKRKLKARRGSLSSNDDDVQMFQLILA